MKSLMHFFVAILSVVTITACAKSSTEQAKDNADTAIAEFNTAANAVDAMAHPTSSWSDAQLDQHDATVRNCAAKADRVESLDGKDGIIIYGTWSMPMVRRVLARRLEESATARREKLAASTRLSRDVDDVLRDSRVARSRNLVTMYEMQRYDMVRAGTPNWSWSKTTRTEEAARLTTAEGYLTEMQTLGSESVYTAVEIESARRFVSERRRALEALQP